MPTYEIMVPCTNCGGSGGWEVSREAAIDAGDLRLEGTFIECSTCGGYGAVVDYIEEPDEDA